MSEARYIVGDARDVLATLPDASVDLILTSPPFLALRSYLPADHPDKAKEIGSEATPGAFLDVLLDVVVELRRVLAPHGSLCVELGDTYAGSGNDGGPQGPGISGDGGARWRDREAGTINDQQRKGNGWPLAKSLCMVPQSFAWALAYGRNPWTGRELEPWRVRNIIRWCRPNPPVGALGDKFRPATSEMVVACVGGSRYFDLDAVREPHQSPPHAVGSAMVAGEPRGKTNGMSNPVGAPPLDYWVIPTHPFSGAHYATFPPDLCIRPIKAMCPERVCLVCGKPSERITENRTERYDLIVDKVAPEVCGMPATGRGHLAVRDVETLGWSDCGCCADGYGRRPKRPLTLADCCDHTHWRRGLVLDPFAGSGTTLEVATGHGRDAIGIDLDPRNAELARQRIGMFLTVDEFGGERV